MAAWIGQGVGTIKKDYGASYRGAVYYQTLSAKWSRLNSVAAVYDYELDAQENSRSQFWQWKQETRVTVRLSTPRLIGAWLVFGRLNPQQPERGQS